MKKNSWFILVLVLVFAISACAAPAAPATPEVEVKAEPTKDPKYKIGVFVPLTGEQKQYGDAISSGLKMRVDEWNKANGTSYEVVVFDDKGDPKEAVNVANLIVSDPAMIVGMGSYASSNVLAAAPVFEEAGLLLLSPGASHPDVPKAGKYIFTYGVEIIGEMKAIMTKIAEVTNKADVGILYQNTDHGIQTMKTTVDFYPTLGGKVVSAETYIPGTTKDFKPLLSKMDEAGAKAIFLSSTYSDGAAIILQAKDLGLDIKFFGNSQLMQDAFLKVAGDAAEGLIASSNMPVFLESTLANSEAKASLSAEQIDFVTRYKEFTGGLSANGFSVLGYDSVTILLETIADVGTDSDALIEALPEHFLSTKGLLCGDVAGFDDAKRVIRDIGMYIVKDNVWFKYTK